MGLYGDSRITWSILLEVSLDDVPTDAVLRSRWESAVSDYPHLGRVGEVNKWADSTRSEFANSPYGDRDSLVRVASGPSRLLVAAHHGAVDGLGLVGLMGLLLDQPLGTSARGVTRTGAEIGFVRGSIDRVAEVALRPPERLAASGGSAGLVGDVLAATQVAGPHLGSAALLAAASGLLRDWNGAVPRSRQPIVAMGISRRAGESPLPPDRDTAYARLRTIEVHDRESAAAALNEVVIEPDFPETRGGGVGPLVTRLLASRLGASLLISNLGRIEGGTGLRAARFWPTASGPAGVGLGLVSVGESTHLTVRARRGWFDDPAAERMSAILADRLAAG